MSKSNRTDGNRNDRDQNRDTSSVPGDLRDSKQDEEKLKPDEAILDLPDVKDIPGQEFIHAPSMGELADTTISSDDEEGRRLFDQDETEDFVSGNDSDVSRTERSVLEQVDYMPTRDEDNLHQAALDQVDNEGDNLNERGFGQERSGSDLDVPGAELDNRNEDIGEEDEENNDYSLGDTDNDNISETRS